MLVVWAPFECAGNPSSCKSAFSASSIRPTSSGCRDETLRISQDTFSFAGKFAAILLASSLAESSSVSARAASGMPSKTRRNRRARQERLERSVPIIGVLRSATQDNPSNSLQRPQLQEIIAQASWRDADPDLRLAQFVSSMGKLTSPFGSTGTLASAEFAALTFSTQPRVAVLLTDARTPRHCRGDSRTGHRPGGARLG